MEKEKLHALISHLVSIPREELEAQIGAENTRKFLATGQRGKV